MTIVEKARDRYEHYEDQRKRIIQSAIKVFGEHNYDVGTMAMIAKEAGISEAMLYKHFDSKKELFMTCFEEIVGDLMSRYAKCYKSNVEEPLKYLEDSAIAYLNYIKESNAGSKFLVHLFSSTYDPELKEPLVGFFTASLQTVQKALEQAKSKGQLSKKADTELLAWDYVGHYYSLMLASEIGIEQMMDEKRVRAFVRTIFQR
jgi:AcrR family transcriptional regulator